MNYPKAFEDLINNLKKLPGIGPRSAERMAYQIIEMNNDSIQELANCLSTIKENIHRCKICGNICNEDICEICNSELRDSSLLCVVQSSKDLYALDKSNEYKGLYHVLNGLISPINGIGPEDLNIDSLIKRIEEGNIKEVIIATNPTADGELTALYLSKLLSKYDILVTRIAYGLPVGANIDYADEFTLIRALEGRRKI